MAAGASPTSDDGHPGPCDYYMVRVARPAAGATPAAPALSGLVERLGTGEKHPFADVAELVRLITAGSLPVTSDRPLD